MHTIIAIGMKLQHIYNIRFVYKVCLTCWVGDVGFESHTGKKRIESCWLTDILDKNAISTLDEDQAA